MGQCRVISLGQQVGKRGRTAGLALRGTRVLRRASAWTATLAFIVNSHWYVLSGSDRKDFRVGYFPLVVLLSFVGVRTIRAFAPDV